MPNQNSKLSTQATPQLTARATKALLTKEQRDRWAAMIADGSDQFPTGLTGHDQMRLLTEVRWRRRDRLVHHIAWAIALDLRNTTEMRRC